MESKYETAYKTISVKTIDGSIFQGEINVYKYDRLSDLFRDRKDDFIVFVNAIGLTSSQNPKTMILNKKHIIFVEPE